MFQPQLSNPPGKMSLEQMVRGGGEMGRRICAFDWSQTPLGDFTHWSQTLKSAVSFLLPSKAQICLFWGSQFITLYNDAYSVVLGAKHPHVLGTPGWVCWSEIWDDRLGPLLNGVVETGEAFWARDYLVFLQRHGFAEETYFDVSYDPVRDETGNVGGVFCIVNETTQRVLSERRLRTLHRLGERVGEGKNTQDTVDNAATVLADNQADVPFALIYLLDEAGQRAHLAGSSGIDAASDMAISVIDVNDAAGKRWQLDTLLQTGQPMLVERLADQFKLIPAGTWLEPPHSALVLPLMASGRAQAIGFVIAGISSRLALDEDYRRFFELMVGHITTSIANARAYEEERKRSQALAELDRAKTEFFSNISHEFRTPLTLMLNPLQEMMEHSDTIPADQRENLETAYRNSGRLLRLVNTLLDYSRIQSNRIRASFEPTDLAQLTADLASSFRSLIERAGLRLQVDCPPLPELLYVDRELWEKIVLNLLSNAFKFTFEGEIAVTLRTHGDSVQMTVRDTGIGIPADELPHIFERFHRVRDARSRTVEGSGIGLALVAEIVRLHGGQIDVNSTPDIGTTFTVSIPLGMAHLPPEQIGAPRTLSSTALGASVYTDEAFRWLNDERGDPTDEFIAPSPDVIDASILIADDNADMRDYLRRLLERRYRVQIANDGLSALQQIERQMPNLVITDVMMPNLDGFELLARLRSNPKTRTLPVLLLSARAGEEARIEGLQAGADDYLTKPFAALELLARVEAQLKLAMLRQRIDARDKFYLTLADTLRPLTDPVEIQAEAARVLGEYLSANRVAYCEIISDDEAILHLDYVDNVPSIKGRYRLADFGERVIDTFRRGETVIVNDVTENLDFTPEQQAVYAMLSIRAFVGVGLIKGGNWVACMGVYAGQAHHWTDDEIELVKETAERTWAAVERAKVETALHETESRLQLAQHAGNVGMWDWDVVNRTTYWSEVMWSLYGLEPQPMPFKSDFWHTRLYPDDRPHVRTKIAAILRSSESDYRDEFRIVHPNGDVRWTESIGRVIRDENNRPLRMSGVSFDITERKLAEEHTERLRTQLYETEAKARREAEQANDLKIKFLGMISHELRTPLASIKGFSSTLMAKDVEFTPDQQQQFLTVIDEEADRLVELVEQLLDLSRLHSGMLRIEVKPQPLRDIINIAMTQLYLLTINHRLEINLPPDLPMVVADSDRIAQVLVNLVGNAAKFSPRSTLIIVRAAKTDEQVRVDVIDDGIGIPAEERETVFEAFRQGERKDQSQRLGAGLGLAICKSVIEAHGGHIWIQDRTVGTMISFVLPTRASMCVD